jgi:hypothetical protein
MAKISKKDLEVLTSEQIKMFYTLEDISKFNISPIKEYLENGKDEPFTLSNKLLRIENLLNIIIVERFVNDTL